MNVTELKSVVRDHGGDVTDVGYESFGNYTKAFVEVYFEVADSVPTIEVLEDAENVVIDSEWDAENNGVMYEVTLSER